MCLCAHTHLPRRYGLLRYPMHARTHTRTRAHTYMECYDTAHEHKNARTDISGSFYRPVYNFQNPPLQMYIQGSICNYHKQKWKIYIVLYLAIIFHLPFNLCFNTCLVLVFFQKNRLSILFFSWSLIPPFIVYTLFRTTRLAVFIIDNGVRTHAQTRAHTLHHAKQLKK
jgi:hypothetical protein